MVPKVWSLPREIRVQLSDHSGRQRAGAHENHLVIVLHNAPEGTSRRRKSFYFWRSPEGEWSFSGQGHGLLPMKRMVDEYLRIAESLEAEYETSNDAERLFRILELATPQKRAARNFRDALNEAKRLIDDHALIEELQPHVDRMSEAARTSELIQDDARNSIDYLVARESRIQSAVSQQQALAAHRLNVLASIFLPLGTIAAVFGMNMHHGLEGFPVWVFWLVMILGATVGGGICAFVLGFGASNFEQLIELEHQQRKATSSAS